LQQETGASEVKKVSLGQINPEQLHKEVVCISLLEIDREFLASMNQRDMDLLRGITNVVTTVLWLTGADMLGRNLDSRLTLSSGLSRALMLEQPSLRFAVMDVGPVGLPDSGLASTFENIIRALQCSSGMDDKEFIQKDRLLYISRFVPDFEANSLFRRRLETQEPVRKVTLAAARPARLSIGRVGVTDTIYFQQLRQPPTSAIPSGFVDVLVKAVSLNAKDVYAVNGRVETHTATSTLEFSGIVVAVGSGVTHLKPGDPAVVLAPSHFSTTERVPAWAAHKMLPGEQFTIMPTLPLAYVTALYGLRECGRLRSGESVLIHGGSGAVGMAAIAIAQRTGAIVYATAGSPAKRRFVAAELGLPEAHIFNSRDASFVADIMAATAGRGVDVVFNSLVGDLMHASWDCLAQFGRFVEVGKRELVDAGKLNMHVFLRNATFTAFDMTDLYFSQDPYRRDLLARCV
jgi:NADPH:quinone reductase-like Zn-dependent oxidoreductase